MLIRGDARQLPLQDACVDCCVSSPPYWGLRSYPDTRQIGLEPTPDAYVRDLVAVFAEVRRVLKPEGTVWCNLGDSYVSVGTGTQGNDGEMADRAVVKARAQVRDNKAVHDSVRRLRPKQLVGIPWRVAFALQADGWYLRSDIIWSKPNPMPESVTDRPTKAHEYLFLLTKSERYFYDADAIAEPLMTDERENYPARAQIIGRGGLLSLEQGTSPQQRSSGGFPPRALTWLNRDEIGSPSQMRSLVSETGDRYMSGRVRAKFAAENDLPLTRNRRTVWTSPAVRSEGWCSIRSSARALWLPWRNGSAGRGVGVDLSYQQLAKERTAQRGLRFEEATA